MHVSPWILAAAVALTGCDRTIARDSPAPGPCDLLYDRRPDDESTCIELARAAHWAALGHPSDALSAFVDLDRPEQRPGLRALTALHRARHDTDPLARLEAYARAYADARDADELAVATMAAAEAVTATPDTHRAEAEAWGARMEEVAHDTTHPAVASALANARGRVAYDGRQAEQSVQQFLLAVGHAQRWWGPDTPEVAQALGNLGRAHRQARQPEQARAAFERALAILEADPGPHALRIASVLGHRGAMRMSEAEYAPAAADLRRAMELTRDRLGPTHPETAHARMNLAVALGKSDELSAAIVQFDQAVDDLSRARGADDPLVASALINRGVVLARQQLLDEASDNYMSALAALETPAREGSREHVFALVNLAATRMRQRRFDNAVQGLRRALALSEAAGRGSSLPMAVVHVNLCESLGATGDSATAVTHCQRSLEIREDHLPPEHPAVTRARDALTKARAALEGSSGGAPP
ncbi:MAG: tetratricopeptide repeat protein [Deltaproteobacteria bacterium]|nr:tetratricopeptide repeat protein [Deltaproteobacteria bacterium]